MDADNSDRLRLSLEAMEKPLINGLPEAITSICNQYYPKQSDSCQVDMAQSVGRRWQALAKIAVGINETSMAKGYFSMAIEVGYPYAHFDHLFLTVQDENEKWDAGDVVKSAYLGSESGDPRAQYLVALMQLEEKTQANFNIQQFLIAKLSNAKSVPTIGDSYFELAMLIKSGSVGSDLSYENLLMRSDFYGNINASLLMVDFLKEQQASPQNDQLIDKWLTKAAGYGFPKAQYNLAMKYSKDQKNSETLEKAARLLAGAAQQNLPEAQTALGVLLFYGNDVVTQDKEAGVQLLERAASVNDPVALFNLGMIWLGQDGDNSQKAGDYLSRSAALGSREARNFLDQIDM